MDESADVVYLLLGVHEVAQMLDVSTQRIHDLRAQGRFPDPTVTLKCGPIWYRSTIQRFLDEWDRRPGPKVTAQ